MRRRILVDVELVNGESGAMLLVVDELCDCLEKLAENHAVSDYGLALLPNPLPIVEPKGEKK